MSEHELGSFHWIYGWVPAVRTFEEVCLNHVFSKQDNVCTGASNHCCGCSDNPAQLLAVFPGTVWDRHSELRAPLCRGPNSGPEKCFNSHRGACAHQLELRAPSEGCQDGVYPSLRSSISGFPARICKVSVCGCSTKCTGWDNRMRIHYSLI